MFYHIWIKFGLEELHGMLLDNCEFCDNGFSEKYASPWGVIYDYCISIFFSRIYEILYRIFFMIIFLATFVISAQSKSQFIEGRQ